MVERTGAGDPARVLPLLWGHAVRTGRNGVGLEDVLRAATTLADRDGIERLSMRRLADELGMGTMTLYAHVPGKAELVDLMVDHVHGQVRHPPADAPDGWQQGLREVARANWDLLCEHPWLLDVDTTRPPLGPGTIGKYDAELGVLADAGLDDVEVDQVLSLVLEHTKASARQFLSTASQGSDDSTDQEWWDRSGPLLAAFMDDKQFPHAARIGEAAGEEYGAATDPQRAFDFGLDTVLAGIAVLVEGRSRSAD